MEKKIMKLLEDWNVNKHKRKLMTEELLDLYNVSCRNCKHITDYDYEYDEDTLWEKPVGKCGNKESENFGVRVDANDDRCSDYDN